MLKQDFFANLSYPIAAVSYEEITTKEELLAFIKAVRKNIQGYARALTEEEEKLDILYSVLCVLLSYTLFGRDQCKSIKSNLPEVCIENDVYDTKKEFIRYIIDIWRAYPTTDLVSCFRCYEIVLENANLSHLPEKITQFIVKTFLPLVNSIEINFMNRSKVLK